MFPSPGHLVSVQTHLDPSPAQASQEYILEGCPHPFTQTSVFNYSILNVSKNPVIVLFFFKAAVVVNRTLKELLRREIDPFTRHGRSYTLMDVRSGSMALLCTPKHNRSWSHRLPGSQHILVCWFQSYRKISSWPTWSNRRAEKWWEPCKELISYCKWRDDPTRSHNQKDRVSFMCSCGLYH